MPFVLLLLALLVRVAFLFAAAWLLTLAIPELIADPDSFRGWLGVVVAAGIAIGSTLRVNN